MIINHPLLGPRDANEFIHLGDESMIDRSWLVVTRDTVTHEIFNVELARDVARSRGRSK